MDSKIGFLFKFMRGNRLLYAGAILSIGLATIFSISIPLVLRFMIDSVIGNKPMHIPDGLFSLIKVFGVKGIISKNLWIGSLILVLLASGRGLFLFLKGKWSAIASESVVRNIRELLYDHIQHLSYDYHVKAKTGDLIQRCTSDVDTIRRFLAIQFIEIGRGLFMVCGVLPIMLMLDIRMTVISLSVVPAIFMFAIVFFVKVKSAFKISDEAEAKLSTVLQENLTGVRVVRAFARQSYEIDRFEHMNVNYRDLTYRLIKLLAYYWSFSDFLCLLQIGAVLLIGAYMASQSIISLGTFFVFSSYVGMLLWPVRQMGRILTDMGKALVSLGRIGEILSEPVEDLRGTGKKPKIIGNVEFSGVGFKYGKGKPVLKNISFSIKSGQTISILGPTGSGKTTLVHLLLALYDYTEGSIKIDGIELREIDLKWLREHVGIVMQEPFLYSKTMKENIGVVNKSAEDSEIFEAARSAAIHDVILGFEQGYETPVGERGVTVSGGQKQRVAIARTLVKNYPILIFDDSLSAVDTETDIAIRKALREREHQATTFIISHRITTLCEADLIIVLDRGKIVQSGKHSELINQEGLYRKIWFLQSSVKIDDIAKGTVEKH
jgi:ATP-binding cassette subfamily B protein